MEQKNYHYTTSTYDAGETWAQDQTQKIPTEEELKALYKSNATGLPKHGWAWILSTSETLASQINIATWHTKLDAKSQLGVTICYVVEAKKVAKEVKPKVEKGE